jgi:hypothetical protein
VDEGQNAKLNNTERFATVHEDCKETQLSLVKKLDVHQMMIVPPMRSAISYLALILEKNVNVYVLEEYVLKEQAVKLQITKKYVPAIIL